MTSNKKNYFQSLDGIRFICAFWVVIHHYGIPDFTAAMSHVIPYGLASIVQKVVFSVFNGTLAVMAFFIISGFCIHLSCASGKNVNIKKFYISRFIRICIPMLIAIFVSLQLPDGYNQLSMVLWSLYCEIIYYIIYPILIYLFSRYGIYNIFYVSLLASLFQCFMPGDMHNGFFWTYGVLGTAVLGLPVWIMGCILAEKIVNSTKPSKLSRTSSVLLLRITILLLCVITAALHSLTPIKLKLSMLIVSPICFLWLYSELVQQKTQLIIRKLCNFGKASYSIYLIHKLAIPILYLFGIYLNNWILLISFAVIISSIYYFLVERPSHLMALHFKKKS